MLPTLVHADGPGQPRTWTCTNTKFPSLTRAFIAEMCVEGRGECWRACVLQSDKAGLPSPPSPSRFLILGNLASPCLSFPLYKIGLVITVQTSELGLGSVRWGMYACSGWAWLRVSVRTR